MKTTARQAYSKAIEMKMKFQERGYGVMAIFINECPDCDGTGKIDNRTCVTCGNEPDDASKFVKVNNNWYRKIQ